MADRDMALKHCERLQRSPSAALRRVAFAVSLTAVSESSREELLLTALADPSAPVQRLAVKCVRRGALVPPAPRLVEIGLSHGTAGGLSRALSMLRHAPTWTRLSCLLLAWEQAVSPEQKSVGMDALDRWEMDARKSFVAPTLNDAAEVQSQWRKVFDKLPDTFVQRARMHLQTYKLE
jgi:hypothetical protein